MKSQSIPLKIALNSCSINEIESESEISKFEYEQHFWLNVRACINKIKKKGWCYCHNEDEIEEMRKKFGQIKIENVIINGEEYEGVWKIRKG